MQRRNLKTAVVGERGQTRGFRRGHRLEPRIAGEIRSVLLGLRQAKRTRADHFDPGIGQHFGDLKALGLVVGGKDETIAGGEVIHGASLNGRKIRSSFCVQKEEPPISSIY